MRYQSDELRKRTKNFAVEIVRLWRTLPRTEEARVIGKQLLRSATSIAANYRAVCRSRSRAEFVARMGVVLEESDETVLWIELLGDTGVLAKSATSKHLEESNELLAIFAASYHTARQ